MLPYVTTARPYACVLSVVKTTRIVHFFPGISWYQTTPVTGKNMQYVTGDNNGKGDMVLDPIIP